MLSRPDFRNGTSNQLYPSDLTDREWQYIKPLIPPPKPGGRSRQTDMRLTLNAIFYLTRAGCAWRYLPRDYPPWPTVYGYFRAWRRDGTWQRIHDRLRARNRLQEGRAVQPTAAILDSQSVKTTDRGGAERGYDAGKKTFGRKRHLLLDTLGLVLRVVVHSAGTGGPRRGPSSPRPPGSSFHPAAQDFGRRHLHRGRARMGRSLRRRQPIDFEIVKRADGVEGFEVLPIRWIVERTFAWLSFHRRLSKDYEYLPATSEAVIHIAMIRVMLSRLT